MKHDATLLFILLGFGVGGAEHQLFILLVLGASVFFFFGLGQTLVDWVNLSPVHICAMSIYGCYISCDKLKENTRDLSSLKVKHRQKSKG